MYIYKKLYAHDISNSLLFSTNAKEQRRLKWFMQIAPGSPIYNLLFAGVLKDLFRKARKSASPKLSDKKYIIANRMRLRPTRLCMRSGFPIPGVWCWMDYCYQVHGNEISGAGWLLSYSKLSMCPSNLRWRLWELTLKEACGCWVSIAYI